MFTGAHDKLVDKLMFTTLLMQLKAAVLVKAPQSCLLKPNCLIQITRKHRAHVNSHQLTV